MPLGVPNIVALQGFFINGIANFVVWNCFAIIRWRGIWHLVHAAYTSGAARLFCWISPCHYFVFKRNFGRLTDSIYGAQQVVVVSDFHVAGRGCGWRGSFVRAVATRANPGCSGIHNIGRHSVEYSIMGNFHKPIISWGRCGNIRHIFGAGCQKTSEHFHLYSFEPVIDWAIRARHAFRLRKVGHTHWSRLVLSWHYFTDSYCNSIKVT